MNEREWRIYLHRLPWTCPRCAKENRGARESQVGRITGRCPDCGWFDLLYIWGGMGWIDTLASSIVLEAS